MSGVTVRPILQNFITNPGSWRHDSVSNQEPGDQTFRQWTLLV
jgi:hypothetical protein